MHRLMKMETTIISLPDGEYQIDDVWVDSESKLYPIAKSFTVLDNAVVNPKVLNLDLSETSLKCKRVCSERWSASCRFMGQCKYYYW